MSRLYEMARPVLMRIDPELAHDLTLRALRNGLAPRYVPTANSALEVSLFNRKFPNPVGLAAGFDKDASAIASLFDLGFGFIEAGTVTPKAQDGNPRPRIFRHKASGSIINAMGFPGKGMQNFRTNLERFFADKPRNAGVLGINIGMNKGQTEPEKDYQVLIRHLGPLADYLTVNISSPNTNGLRDLQKPQNLRPFLESLMEERARSCGSAPPALLVKLSPDLEPEQEVGIAHALSILGIDGIVMTNTTIDRLPDMPLDLSLRKGGMSGPGLKARSTAAIRRFYTMTGGKLPIIGVGGIENAQDAYEKIRAGASLIQLYTGLTAKGPQLVRDINLGLLRLLQKDGFSSITQATGSDYGSRNILRTGT